MSSSSNPLDFTMVGGGETSKKTFFTHVFSTTEEGKAEILNVAQYATLGVIPVVILNKLIQRFIPEADPDKSSVELLIEVFIQLIIMFCGVVLIHRLITYIPTYSGFVYEHLSLTNAILSFLIIVLSVQTKLGIKVNILFDRINDLWNGETQDAKANAKSKAKVRTSHSLLQHTPSQSDHLDSGLQSDMFPPAPVATAKQQPNGTYDHMMRGNPATGALGALGPMAANSVLGGGFGSLF
jgi:hypothetical protein